MTRVTAAEVMIEHNSKLARNPAHLRRLIAFWPEENIVHQLAKQALNAIELKQDDREYIVQCHSFKGSAWLHPGKDGPAWYFEGSELLIDNDEVTIIEKVIKDWDSEAEVEK